MFGARQSFLSEALGGHLHGSQRTAQVESELSSQISPSRNAFGLIQFVVPRRQFSSHAIERMSQLPYLVGRVKLYSKAPIAGSYLSEPLSQSLERTRHPPFCPP